MGRRKRKKHAKDDAKTKKEEAHGNTDKKQVGWKTAVAHATSNGWVQNSGIAFLLSLIAAGVAFMTRTQIKAAAITFAAAGTLFLWVAALAVINASLDGDGELVVNVTGALFSTPWWLRYHTSEGDTISPLPIMIFATITNTKDIPVTLDSLSASIQIRGKSWVKLQHVETTAGDVYWAQNLNDAGLLDLSGNGLDNLLLSSLEPHKPVRGLLFFDSDPPLLPAQGEEIRYKWEAQDSVGKKYEFTSEYSLVGTNLAGPYDAKFSGARLVFKRAHIDLTKQNLTTKRWEEGIIVIPNK